MANDKNKDVITKYLGDQIGVVGHVSQAIDKQVKATQDERDINPLLAEIKGILEGQTNNLTSRLEALGGKASSPIKEVGASVLGVAAGAIDAVRDEKVSKDLRDDYTALGLVNISYTMLITTALALGDRETAQLAAGNLKQTAKCVTKLGKTISYAVVKDLSDDASVSPNAVQEGQQMYSDAWKQDSGS